MTGAVIHRVLPAGPAPKPLTARHRPQSLREHFLAFLAANNPGGFANDQPTEAETSLLIGYAGIVQAMPDISPRQIKEMAHAIRLKLYNPLITPEQCNNLVFLMAGYPTRDEAATRKVMRNGMWVYPIRQFAYLGEVTDAADHTDEALEEIQVFSGNGRGRKYDETIDRKRRGEALCAMAVRKDAVALLSQLAGVGLKATLSHIAKLPVDSTISKQDIHAFARVFGKRLDIDKRTSKGLVAALIGYSDFPTIMANYDHPAALVTVLHQLITPELLTNFK